MTPDIDATRMALRITCADALTLMTDFIEDALGAADRERLEDHLRGCEACAVYLDQVRLTVRIVGACRADDYDVDEVTMRRLTERFRGAVGP